MGHVKNSTIKKVSVRDNSVEGENAGGLVGKLGNSSIIKSHADIDSIGNNKYLGGLVGISEFSSIKESYAIGDVGGNNTVGGLVEMFEGENSQHSIENSYFKGALHANNNSEDLIGKEI